MTNNTRFTSSVVCQNKQTTFFVSLFAHFCHPLLSDLFAGQTLDSCATSLAGINRDLPHVLNVSPVNRLERQIVAMQVRSLQSVIINPVY